MSEEKKGKSESELEEAWNELMEDLERVNTSFPSLERLEGWIPKEAIEKRRIILAEKKVERTCVLREFKPIGVWKEVYDLFVLREKILGEMNRIARKSDGPAVFTSKELAMNDDES